MPGMDFLMEYVIRYGFQVLGAVIVFAAGALVAAAAVVSTDAVRCYVAGPTAPFRPAGSPTPSRRANSRWPWS